MLSVRDGVLRDNNQWPWPRIPLAMALKGIGQFWGRHSKMPLTDSPLVAAASEHVNFLTVTD